MMINQLKYEIIKPSEQAIKEQTNERVEAAANVLQPQ